MASLNRLCPVGVAQHIVQRDNNRQVFLTAIKNGSLRKLVERVCREISGENSCMDFHDKPCALVSN